MPTLSETRERTEYFARSSMQQVRSVTSRSFNFIQQRFSAFNKCLTGKASENDQNWSTTTSERNLSGCVSSKTLEKGFRVCSHFLIISATFRISLTNNKHSEYKYVLLHIYFSVQNKNFSLY